MHGPEVFFEIKNKYSICWLPRESKIVLYVVYYIFWSRAASWSIRQTTVGLIEYS